MLTPQLEILQELQSQNRLCLSPPTDDDDAYAITIARKEDKKAKNRRMEVQNSSLNETKDAQALEGAFVLSNDMFRDAMDRDNSGELREWLCDHRSGKDIDKNGTFLSGRISFSFCNVGSIDDYGDPVLDFLPNPRHQLIATIEKNKAIS